MHVQHAGKRDSQSLATCSIERQLCGSIHQDAGLCVLSAGHNDCPQRIPSMDDDGPLFAQLGKLVAEEEAEAEAAGQGLRQVGDAGLNQVGCLSPEA